MKNFIKGLAYFAAKTWVAQTRAPRLYKRLPEPSAKELKQFEKAIKVGIGVGICKLLGLKSGRYYEK